MGQRRTRVDRDDHRAPEQALGYARRRVNVDGNVIVRRRHFDVGGTATTVSGEMQLFSTAAAPIENGVM